MPMTSGNVTVASRIMLPAYVVLFGGLGANYFLTNPGRLTVSPTLEYADTILPLFVWGLVFLGVSALMAGAICRHSRWLYRYALWVAIICMATWAIVFAFAAFKTDASPGAWLWPTFAAVCCYASNRSLLAGETT